MAEHLKGYNLADQRVRDLIHLAAGANANVVEWGSGWLTIASTTHTPVFEEGVPVLTDELRTALEAALLTPDPHSAAAEGRAI